MSDRPSSNFFARCEHHPMFGVVALGCCIASGCANTQSGADAAINPRDVFDASVHKDDATNDMAEACRRDVSAIEAGGARHGFIRFANVARAVGTVRFVARSLPGFVRCRVEAVVREGESSEQIRTLPVAFEVHAEAAPGATPSVRAEADTPDAGMLTIGPFAPTTKCPAVRAPSDLNEPFCSDVYDLAGCTVMFAGSIAGSERDRTNRRLLRMSDLPLRTADCDVGRVRVLNLYAEAPSLSVTTSAGTALVSGLVYFDTSGQRTLPVGRISVRAQTEVMDLGTLTPTASIMPGHTHTLYIWGDARAERDRSAGALLIDDVSPTFR
jgi:hypothetical protein